MPEMRPLDRENRKRRRPASEKVPALRRQSRSSHLGIVHSIQGLRLVRHRLRRKKIRLRHAQRRQARNRIQRRLQGFRREGFSTEGFRNQGFRNQRFGSEREENRKIGEEEMMVPGLADPAESLSSDAANLMAPNRVPEG